LTGIGTLDKDDEIVRVVDRSSFSGTGLVFNVVRRLDLLVLLA
jgi:hypothetical protein